MVTFLDLAWRSGRRTKVRQVAREPARTESTRDYRDAPQDHQHRSCREADRNDSVAVSETGAKANPGSVKRKRSAECINDAQRNHSLPGDRYWLKRCQTEVDNDGAPRPTERYLNGSHTTELQGTEHILIQSDR